MTAGSSPATALDIPFHVPSITEAEREAVLRVLDSGWLTTGERAQEFEEAIAARLGSRHAVAVNSATAALHLALEALGVGPGDEVIVPTYTFAACGEVVRYLGARPRLADVDELTLNISARTIEPHLRPTTRAVIVVHFGGLVADMDPILALARQRGMAVVEDAAHALPASTGNRAAGSIGDVGALSFYATKTVTTGEGGMLVTDSDDVADRARVMRLHGISRDAWKRYTAAGSWYYEIEDVGFKYNLPDLAAAIGLVQLGRADEMRSARERIAEAYRERLSDRLGEALDLPAQAPPGDVHAWHLFPVRLREGGAERREQVIDRLRASGIGVSVHFIPLHLHPYYRRTYGYAPADLPIATREYEREISLPIYPDLADPAIDRVVDALADAIAGTAA
ncbi:MAG TPA: DegT/DnrJ/EryC1/StrS family aminotransferase [Candidatus Limnocylindrales bacterium]|nr:DegT/DnrJ/EryC1/StrS family aminotransferase [Candidatus Limnocylindrales bacterium]